MTAAVVRRLRALPSWQVTLGLALLALGFLVAAQLSSQGPRSAYTSQERAPLVATVLDLQAQQDALKQQILTTREAIQDLESVGQGGQQIARELNDRIERARIAAALIPLTGPGIVFQLTDSTAPVPPGASERDYLVSGDDVLTVVQELWLAGAEAVSVNGERITAATAIVDIGGSILVNAAYVAAPYQVSAIGPAEMYERMTQSPGFVAFIRERADGYGIGVEWASPGAVDLPAYAGTVSLRHARVVGPVPDPSPERVP